MVDASARARQVRRKQFVIVGAGAAILLGLSLAASYWLQPSRSNERGATEIPKTKSLSMAGTAVDKDAWRVQSAAEMRDFQQRFEQRLAAIERERRPASSTGPEAAASSPRDAASSPVSPAPSQPMPIAPVAPPLRPVAPAPSTSSPAGPPPRLGLFDQVGTGTVPPPPTRAAPTALGPTPPGLGNVGAARSSVAQAAPPGTPARIRSVTSLDAPDPDQKVASKAAGEVTTEARRFGDTEAKRRAEKDRQRADSGKERYSDDDPLSYNRAGGRSADTYLPAGTFVRAVLLNGMDAPTGGQSQSNPHPLLLRLVDDAKLPNGAQVNLKDCQVTANGHGSLSDERAYLRLDRLSCVDDEGGAIDVAVKGYIAGEDGKTGVRGRLITKSGQVIANALMVGALSGFGEALKQGSVATTTATATGAQTQSVTNALGYGLGGGTAKAMDRIASYYMKLADKMYPVVEVDAGRVVEVVLTQGVSIERKSQ